MSKRRTDTVDDKGYVRIGLKWKYRAAPDDKKSKGRALLKGK